MITVAIYKRQEDPGPASSRPAVITVDRSECKIGRSNNNHVVLDDPAVSTEHARIYREGEGYFIRDMKSWQGTFIQGIRLPKLHKIKLHLGTIVQICDYFIRLENKGKHPKPSVPDHDSSKKIAEVVQLNPKTTKREDDYRNLRMFELKAEVHQQLLDVIELPRLGFDQTNDEALRNQCHTIVRKILSERRYQDLRKIDQSEVIKDILDEALGLGPLETFLADEQVTEIMVNRYDRIYIEKNGKLKRSRKKFSNTKSVHHIIARIVGPLGRRLDESSPMVDARLADGSRVNVVIPPLAVDGPCLTIRKFPTISLGVADMLRNDSITAAMVEFIKTCVVHRKNILIAGGTGSGKTATLNVFSSFIPKAERVVTIEDTAELRLSQEHVIRLESRPPNIEGKGEITIRHLVNNALRMRPDRIIISECRSGETLDILQAMNTGYEGSLTTTHANSQRNVVSRLETMVLQAGTDLSRRAIREQIASALDIVVQQTRFGCGARKITHISEVVGIDDDRIILQDIFYYKTYGVDKEGNTRGCYLATGWIPGFYNELRNSGAQPDMGVFHN